MFISYRTHLFTITQWQHSKSWQEKEREDTLSREPGFAGCPVVEINKSQINERSKTNGGALCTKERVVVAGFIYFVVRTPPTSRALEHDRVIKEMNSGYSGPPFHTLPPSSSPSSFLFSIGRAGAASFAPICFDPRLSEQPRLIYVIRFRSLLIQFRGASLQFNCWFLENGTSRNLFFVGRISSRFTFKIWYKWIRNLACSSNSLRSEENSTILRLRIPFKSLSLCLSLLPSFPRWIKRKLNQHEIIRRHKKNLKISFIESRSSTPV